MCVSKCTCVSVCVSVHVCIFVCTGMCKHECLCMSALCVLCNIGVSLVIEHPKDTCSVHFDQVLISALTNVYFTKKLL